MPITSEQRLANITPAQSREADKVYAGGKYELEAAINKDGDIPQEESYYSLATSCYTTLWHPLPRMWWASIIGWERKLARVHLVSYSRAQIC